MAVKGYDERIFTGEDGDWYDMHCGDRHMTTFTNRPGAGSAAARSMLCVVACGVLCTGSARAQDTTTWRQQEVVELQKLNGVLPFLRQRNATDYAITTPNGIDEGKFVEIGGIEQWITIRGFDRGNPVLLFLHGGPGDATNPWGHVALRSWLKDFTVVQWDQRGAGRTFGRSGPSVAPTITIDRMAQDGIELTELLRRTLNVNKVVLVGHSWGSTLGVYMVKARPERLVRGTGAERRPTRAANECPARRCVERQLRVAGVRDPGSGRLYDAHEPGADVRQFDPRATQGVREHSRKRALRGLHEVRCLPEGARRAGTPAGRTSLTCLRRSRSD